MEERRKYYESTIRASLRALGRDPSPLEPTIFLLGTAFALHEKCIEEMAGQPLVVTTPTNGSLQQNPIYKILIANQDSILKQLKNIGLTWERTTEGVEQEPMTALIEDLQRAAGK